MRTAKKLIFAGIIEAIVVFLLFVLVKYLTLGQSLLTTINKKDDVEEIFALIIIFYLIYIIIHLYFELLKYKFQNPLLSIQSKMLRSRSHNFTEEIVTKISSTFSTMLINKTSTILWELENLDLNDIESKCLYCKLDDLDKKCQNIPKMIKIKRRNRITNIANSLIIKKGEYFATETRSPSEIIKLDKGYYADQNKDLSKYNVTKACRLLILSYQNLQDELQKKNKDLKKYIECNKDIEFKIIAFKDTINDVFNTHTLEIENQFFDFVVSKKKSKITVFAQNPNYFLTSLDSTYDNNAGDALKFHKAFTTLFNQTENGDVKNESRTIGRRIINRVIKQKQLDKKGNEIIGDKISYSLKINTFEEAENFIKKLDIDTLKTTNNDSSISSIKTPLIRGKMGTKVSHNYKEMALKANEKKQIKKRKPAKSNNNSKPIS